MNCRKRALADLQGVEDICILLACKVRFSRSDVPLAQESAHMANLNKVMLIGRLTRDPEMRTFSTGGKVANFGFAVNNFKRNPTLSPSKLSIEEKRAASWPIWSKNFFARGTRLTWRVIFSWTSGPARMV